MKNSHPFEYHFIVCHKPFVDKFSDYSLRTFISDNGTPGTTKIETEYDSRVMGELPFWKWIATQIDDNDIACLHHYRRKLPLSLSQVVVAQPMNVGNVLKQTGFYHSPKLSEALCKTLSPDEVKLLNGPSFFPYCIFKAPRGIIWEWVNYVEPRILQCMQLIGCPLDFKGACEFVRNDESFTKPVDGKNTDALYQARIGAFLGERLNSVFWQSLQVNKDFKPVNLLEENQRI